MSSVCVIEKFWVEHDGEEIRQDSVEVVSTAKVGALVCINMAEERGVDRHSEIDGELNEANPIWGAKGQRLVQVDEILYYAEKLGCGDELTIILKDGSRHFEKWVLTVHPLRDAVVPDMAGVFNEVFKCQQEEV